MAHDEGYERPLEPWNDPDDPYVVRLDPDDEFIELWRERFDPADYDFPPREPGIINIRRYPVGMYVNWGVKTFLDRALAVTPDDLRASDVDVAVFGYAHNAPVNAASSGDVWGPMMVRSTYDFSIMHADPKKGGHYEYETLIDPFETLLAVDYGDVATVSWSTERTAEELRRIAYEITEAGAIPFAIGGDHSTPYGMVSGITDVIGKKSAAVIHFDAHIDISKIGFGHRYHSGLWWDLLIKNDAIEANDVILVGIQLYYFGPSDWQMCVDLGFRQNTLHVILRDGIDKLYERLMEQLESIDRIYISFDVDVFDVSYAPGTGSGEMSGLSPNMLLPLLSKLCASKEVVGAEVIEYNPIMDNNGLQTGRLINRVALSILTGIAMYRQGIDPLCIHPLISQVPGEAGPSSDAD